MTVTTQSCDSHLSTENVLLAYRCKECPGHCMCGVHFIMCSVCVHTVCMLCYVVYTSHTCTHTSHACTHTHITHMHTHTCTHTSHTCTHTCTHTSHTCTHTSHACTHTHHTHAHTHHTHAHTHITHMHTHTHTHSPTLLSSLVSCGRTHRYCSLSVVVITTLSPARSSLRLRRL